jgi:formate dehydrogenase gamma subunit
MRKAPAGLVFSRGANGSMLWIARSEGIGPFVFPVQGKSLLMKRFAAFLLPLLFVTCWSADRLTAIRPVEAQERVTQSTATQPTKLAAIEPDAADPGAKPRLECQECHSGGNTLPYLGGALFHTEPHTAYDHGFHAQAIKNGNKAAACLDCHTRNGDMATILPASDPKSTINRANIAETCGRCHGDKSVMQGSGISNRPFLSYRESVHAQAVARGNLGAAVCTDCHNSHDVLPASNNQSSIFRVNVPQTCGKCHQKEAAEFNESVHGQATARGVSRSPVCTDCHGIHDIKQPFDQTTASASSALATDTCAKCHEGVTLTQEFGVAGGRVSSYKDSYHGLASRLGSKVVANCASCHGVHNILPSSDPRSLISTNNLPQTCGQCHVGATANFTQGKVHLGAATSSEIAASRDLGAFGTKVVRWIYLPLIIFVIGGMVFHNALIWRKKVAAKRRAEDRNIVRLTRNQRIQHWFLLTSFMTLVLSGFALQYPDSWLAWMLGSSEIVRRIMHRAAAVVMLLVGAYHLLYLAFTNDGRRWVKDMLPRLKDVRDVFQNFAYYLGAKGPKPKIARFGYAEKAEYWAVVWGTMIMGFTGLMIWFKIGIFGFLLRGWIDIAIAIHFYEAVLATLAIIVWHFYQVIFDPDVYPINLAFLDGRVSEEYYKEEHELAYEQLKNHAEEQEVETEAHGTEGDSHD